MFQNSEGSKNCKGSICHKSRKRQCNASASIAAFPFAMKLLPTWLASALQVAGAKKPSSFSQGPGNRAKLGGRGLFVLLRHLVFSFAKPQEFKKIANEDHKTSNSTEFTHPRFPPILRLSLYTYIFSCMVCFLQD